jgi:molecular chaperone GrpE
VHEEKTKHDTVEHEQHQQEQPEQKKKKKQQQQQEEKHEKQEQPEEHAKKESEEQAEQQQQPPQGEEEEEVRKRKQAELEEEVQYLRQKVQEFREQALYALAEKENVRRLAKADVEAAKAYGISKFAKDMLEVADNLHSAMQAVPDLSTVDPSSDEARHLASLKMGVEMTLKVFERVLERHGVRRFDPLGQRFDPHMHEALFQVPHGRPGSVAQVTKAGYLLHDRVLRPALVGVVPGTWKDEHDDHPSSSTAATATSAEQPTPDPASASPSSSSDK